MARQYELILFGASGYTGKLTAEYIARHLPINLSWAVAGRNSKRLEEVVQHIREINPDREQPSVEVAELEKASLDTLVKKTTLVINTVGPYFKYGTPVVEACAENGTHYLDCTGEVPWVYDVVEKYHDTAHKSGAIIIPQDGVESCPADVMTWALTKAIREQYSASTREVVVSLHEMKAKPSGGTLSTLLGIVSAYSTAHLLKSMKPFSLCPVPPNAVQLQSSPTVDGIVPRVSGVRTVSDLGTLCTGLASSADAAIVHRSWGLMEKGSIYGPNFRFYEFTRTRNLFTGMLMHYGIMIGALAIAIPPINWLIRKMVFQPGEGPTLEEMKNDRVEWRGIAYSDEAIQKRAMARYRFEGSMYQLTALLLAESAYTILRGDKDIMARRLGGGVLTPATLGDGYIERMKEAGITFSVQMMQ